MRDVDRVDREELSFSRREIMAGSSVVAGAAVLGAMPRKVAAQDGPTMEISGTVTDQSGAVEGATVDAVPHDSGLDVLRTTTDANGEYIFDNGDLHDGENLYHVIARDGTEADPRRGQENYPFIAAEGGPAIPDSEVYYELTDGDFNDDSGNGNDGTGNGDFTFVQEGVQFGGSIENDYAESPDVGLNGDDTATIGVKIIPDGDLSSSTSGRGWIGVHFGNNCWIIGYEGGDLVLQSLSGATVQDTLRHTVDLDQGTSYTVAARSDAQEWDIFLNGSSVASLSASSGPSVGNSGSFKLAPWTGSGVGVLNDTGATAIMADSWAANRAVSNGDIP